VLSLPPAFQIGSRAGMADGNARQIYYFSPRLPQLHIQPFSGRSFEPDEACHTQAYAQSEIEKERECIQDAKLTPGHIVQ
jgi:hypothetical protein